MRVLIVVDTYVPARISAALQMHDFAKELLAQRHEPAVMVPTADLSEGWLLERIDGVLVLRVRAARIKDVGMLRRAMNECLLSFFMWRGLRSSPLSEVRWDGLIWYSPTIFLGPLIAWLKRRHGCRAYLILRDLFPDWAVDAGVMRQGLMYRLFKGIERFQYAVANMIGVQTRANVPLVADDCRDGAARVEVLNNWLAEPLPPTTICALPASLSGRTVFTYTGNMGVAQGMDCLLDLARRLRSRDDIGFLFVGRGSEVARLKRFRDEQGLDHVVFLEEVDATDIPGILQQCHVGLIALHPRHTTHNIPGKLITYFYAGLPVLARINVGNDLQQLIESEGVGFVCTGDSQHLLQPFAEKLAADPNLRSRMGLAGRNFAKRAFSPGGVVVQVIRALRG
ncbi:MAG: glycosyltransferase family 4 protein [Acidobacteriaceae bacterium]